MKYDHLTTTHAMSKLPIKTLVSHGYVTHFCSLMACVTSCLITSIELSRWTLISTSHLMSGLSLMVWIGVDDKTMLGTRSLVLSISLMMVYLMCISSIVQNMFNVQSSLTVCQILIFLWVMIRTHAIIFPMIFSMANQIDSESHHINAHTSNHTIWNVARKLNIISVTKTTFPTRFAILFA